MIEEISVYLKGNITPLIAILALITSILIYRLNRKKFKLDKIDFDNRKSKFSIYLEDSYKFNYKNVNEKLLLFNIRITNFSNTKNSILPKLRIVYFYNGNQTTEIIIEHSPSLFHENYHSNLGKFPLEIRIDEKEIKSGWVIFNFPQILVAKRIDFYELIIEDGQGNTSKVTSNLIKEILYEH
ncbi:hypothetical protein AY601_1998 [Pedobacter cryoconitis]|uniref:DUF4352 domain-containing protein n=1 Tax=Pedobacter cryoconitis TaxID=188932 RepID=A0A127VC95_9SPHI|nr:hypothetical protein [Pedobacter cryoconitis]AMP98904.1 hypothetical protein AY601_1998 [Pedobacter cryoconitis]